MAKSEEFIKKNEKKYERVENRFNFRKLLS